MIRGRRVLTLWGEGSEWVEVMKVCIVDYEVYPASYLLRCTCHNTLLLIAGIEEH